MSIAENADTFTAARKIDHLVKFKDMDQRQGFLNWAVEDGYEIPEMREVDKDGEDDLYRFTLLFCHHVNPSRDLINNITLSLYRKAKEYDGIYDGWGTVLVELEGFNR